MRAVQAEDSRSLSLAELAHRKWAPGLLSAGPSAPSSRLAAVAPLDDFRFEDRLVHFQGLVRVEVVDFPSSLLEPFVERVLR